MNQLDALPLVSIVVVNLNGEKLLRACLASLRDQTYPAGEIILVDNGSSDDSLALVRAEYPDVRIVTLATNQGFAAGCNAGIRVASGDLIATLNNDARAEPTWIAEMVLALADRADVGMVASKLLFAHAPTTVNSAGISLDRTGIAWDRQTGWPDDPTEPPAEVFGPCAAAALYRRRLLEDVGAFDEDFFCYLEDVDLAWRARLAGWRCVFAPRARALHAHSATAGANSAFKRYHLGRNKLWLIAKNYPSPAVWFYLPLIVAYDLAGMLAVTAALARTNGLTTDCLAGAAGRLAGLRGIALAGKKRRAIQSRRRVPTGRVMSSMAGVSWPWNLLRQYGRLQRSEAPATVP